MGTEAAEHGGIDRIALGEASHGTGKRAHALRRDDADGNTCEHRGIGQRTFVAGSGLADEVDGGGRSAGGLEQGSNALGMVGEGADGAGQVDNEFGLGHIDTEMDDGVGLGHGVHVGFVQACDTSSCPE